MIEIISEMGLRYVKIPFYLENGEDANAEGIMSEYEYTLLENTHIPGIAKVSKQIVGGKIFLLYSIHSYVSLEEKIKRDGLNKDIFCDFFQQLLRVYENIQMYLLDGNFLCLNPAYIFYDEREKTYVFLLANVEKTPVCLKFEQLVTFFADICPIEQQELLEFIFESFGNLEEESFEMHSFVKYIAEHRFEETEKEDDVDLFSREDIEEADVEPEEEFEKTKSKSVYVACMVFLIIAVFFGYFVEYEFKYSVVSMTSILLAIGFMVFQVYRTVKYKPKRKST